MMGNGMKDFDRYFSDADLKRAQGIEKKEYKAIIEQMIKDGKAFAADPKGAKRAKPFWIPEVALLVCGLKIQKNKR